MSKCGDCKFFQRIDAKGGGMCRRYPPQVVNGISSDCGEESGNLYQVYSYDETQFPRLFENDWCGEFKPAEFENYKGGIEL